jgi:hypothetical protein
MAFPVLLDGRAYFRAVRYETSCESQIDFRLGKIVRGFMDIMLRLMRGAPRVFRQADKAE